MLHAVMQQQQPQYVQRTGAVSSSGMASGNSRGFSIAGSGSWYAPPPPSGYPTVLASGTQFRMPTQITGTPGVPDNAYQAAMERSGATFAKQDQITIAAVMTAHDSRREYQSILPSGNVLQNRIYRGLPCFVQKDTNDTHLVPGMVRLYSLPEMNRYLYENRNVQDVTLNSRNACAIESRFNFAGVNATIDHPADPARASLPRRVVSQEMFGVTETLADIFSPSDTYFNFEHQLEVQRDVGYQRRMALGAEVIQSMTNLYLILMASTIGFVTGKVPSPYPKVADVRAFAGLFDRSGDEGRYYIDGAEHYANWIDTPFAKQGQGRDHVDMDDVDEDPEMASARRRLNRLRRVDDAERDDDNLEELDVRPAQRRRVGRPVVRDTDVCYALIPFASNRGEPPSPEEFMVTSEVGAPEARVYHIGRYAVDQKFVSNPDTSRRYDLFSSPDAVHNAVINPHSDHAKFLVDVPYMAAHLAAP